jgi:hypothetical protein
MATFARQYIVVRTSFYATHQWSGCKIPEVDFLKNPHRHCFNVELKFETIGDREIEFIKQKMEVDKFIKKIYANKFLGDTSCEQIAQKLLDRFDASGVGVFEDNENGVEIYVSL